jgi:hypothetical protein
VRFSDAFVAWEGPVLGENGSLFSVCPGLMAVIERNLEGAGKDSVREIGWRGPDSRPMVPMTSSVYARCQGERPLRDSFGMDFISVFIGLLAGRVGLVNSEVTDT